MKKTNILVVDDEAPIAELVEACLMNESYTIHKFYNGTDALKSLDSVEYDLAILDVMLPDIDGFELCRRIRENSYFPIIMLTAKVEGIDKITGLTLGADDYVTKPFNPLELTARVSSQLRRYKHYNPLNREESTKEETSYDFDGLQVNRESHKCVLYDKEVELTPIEFSILCYLCENRGKVVSSEQLFEAVWGDKYLNSNNTVMAHIARIREKMKEPPRKPKFIKTVWGVGYTIE